MTVTDPLTAINTRRTAQSRPADARQVQNSAGGYTFALDAEARLRRFLVLGSDGGTYYTSTADLTTENAQVVIDYARRDATGLVAILTEISVEGRAPKQNPTLFALAAAAGLGDIRGRKAALAALPTVARTGTHLFLFARYVEQFRGWGRGLRRAVASWYEDKPVDALAYQTVKYRQREGWSHRDVLRLAHPSTLGEHKRASLYDWICGREPGIMPTLVQAWLTAQSTTEVSVWAHCVYSGGLSWEMLPDAALAEPEVWAALLDRGMPMTALIRQLPRLTRLGLTRSHRETIVKRLTSEEKLQAARVHPINLLVALRTYASGESARGSSTWTPDRKIIDALDAAFYASFKFVEPTGKRTLLALDVSGSMAASAISNMPITAREASAAMAMVTASVEPDVDIVAFTSGRGTSRYDTGITELSISPRQRLDDVLRVTEALRFGATDCALPMIWAQQEGREYDTICVYTDNETWHGNIHPHQALRDYRATTGLDTRLAVVGMTATGFSIADPSDAGMLDVVGFDSATPQLIADFSRGL